MADEVVIDTMTGTCATQAPCLVFPLHLPDGRL
jgi:hypothetical protein